jgi:hypothetical protein
MSGRLAPYGSLVGVDTAIKSIWYSKDDELETEVFDAMPSWMSPIDEECHVEARDNKIIIEALQTRLTEKELKVIYYRFFDNYTLNEVADLYDVTKERIRQIEAKALRKMRWGIYKIAAVCLWQENLKGWNEVLTEEERILIIGEENYKKLVAAEKAEKARRQVQADKRRLEMEKLVDEVAEQRKKGQMWYQNSAQRAYLLNSLYKFNDKMLMDIKEIAIYTFDDELAEKIDNVLYVKSVCSF